MTDKEKAKAYDEAKRIAESLYKASEPMSGCNVIIETLFPELKESEDEKVRKELIKHLKEGAEGYEPAGGSSDYQRWLAWVEKQGEPIDKIVKRAINEKQRVLLTETNGDANIDWDTRSLQDVKLLLEYGLDYIKKLEKQGQKEKDILEDVKEGDVLCDYHEAYDNPLIFILKKFEHVNFGLVRPSDYSSYCFLTPGDRRMFKEGTYHHEHNIKPATKEQRDLLFEKMKEAGYEWDVENKKLKKIAVPIFHIGDRLRYKGHSCDGVITEITDTYYICGDAKLPISTQDKLELVEQKPVWSEEDSIRLQRIIDFLWYNRKGDTDTIYQQEQDIDWLKSLRPQNIYNPYKAVVESIAEMCKHYDKASHSNLRDFYDNVKVKCKDAKEYDNTFPQTHWKPSKEQIDALEHFVRSVGESGYASPYENKTKLLYSLLEQLKKLK